MVEISSTKQVFYVSTYFTFFTIKSTQVLSDLISCLVTDNNFTLLYILYIFKILLSFNQAITQVTIVMSVFLI